MICTDAKKNLPVQHNSVAQKVVHFLLQLNMIEDQEDYKINEGSYTKPQPMKTYSHYAHPLPLPPS